MEYIREGNCLEGGVRTDGRGAAHRSAPGGSRRCVMRPVGAALGRRLEVGDGKTTRAGADGESGERRRAVSRGGKCNTPSVNHLPLSLIMELT